MHSVLKAIAVLLLAIVICVTEFGSVALVGGERGFAVAQEKRDDRIGILRRLFQRRKRETPAQSQQRQSRNPRVNRPNDSAVAPIRAAEVEKSENARRVLVVGDFVSDGMAQGLVEAFSDVETVVVIRRTSGSSGFVRDDFYDWPAQIGQIIGEVQPEIVIMQIGSNDRQAMSVNGTGEKVLTDAWTKEYLARAGAFVKEVRDRDKLLVWVGAPPFKFRSMSADMLAFNEIYRSVVEDSGGYFVDIWDGFVDENGNFALTGDDIKGQKVRLRVGDGINFTKSGNRKMAFYVERQLKALLGNAAAPLLTSLGDNQLPMLQLPPLQTEAELVRTNPISLVDVELDGGSALLGDVEDVATENRNLLASKSFRLRLIEDGLPPPAREGRAGDFRWPGPGELSDSGG